MNEAGNVPATIEVSIEDGGEAAPYNLRQRTRQQHQPQPPQLNVLPDAERVHLKQSWLAWMRSMLVPTEQDKWLAKQRKEQKRYEQSQTLQSLRGFALFKYRARSCAYSSICLLAVVVALVVLWDIIMSEGDVRRTRTAQLLARRDHVYVVERVVLPKPHAGVVVHNVLDPRKAIDNMDEVAALMHKIRHSATQHVQPVTPVHLEQGYAPYKHVSAHDLDAEAVAVNFTFAGLQRVMRAPSNSQLVCEGAIHYNIERNIVAVYDWGTSKNTDYSGVLYNARIVEYATESEEKSALIAEQEHCRIADVILSETAATNTTNESQTVPSSASIEYITSSGFKRRQRVFQPLLACIQHVLKLSGF